MSARSTSARSSISARSTSARSSISARAITLLALPSALIPACVSSVCEKDSRECPNGVLGDGGESGNDSGSGGSSGNGDGGNAGSGFVGPDCTPAPGSSECIGEEFGVFVAPGGDDAQGQGTRESPFASLTKAAQTAKSAGKHVYACADTGAYDEALAIDTPIDGLAFFGGFRCAEGDWTYDQALRARVESDVLIGLRIQNLSAGVILEDFYFLSADGQAPGSSSIGILIANSQDVTLRRVSVTAGKGAAGAHGAPFVARADNGAPGIKGDDACTSPTSQGGPAVTTMCGGVASESIGGKETSSGSNGDVGVPSLGGGAAGVGQTGDTLSCTTGGGQSGEPGPNGGAGVGATSSGILTASGFESSAGASGEDGKVGQGGGGGGGAKAPTSGCAQLTGASGGSGGGGGCGGKGGPGGTGGGASIAIAVIDSTDIILDATDLAAQDGGAGGDGARGQDGGLGATGGERGIGVSGSASACSGGDGGDGGNGGPGGGGVGGASIGVAFQGAAPTRTGGTITVAMTAATGGLDGLGQATGTGAGAAGVTADEYSF
jgi:hypothetical protein